MALFDADLAEADTGAPLDEVELDQGDAMWFSPTWYQTVSPCPRSCLCSNPILEPSLQDLNRVTLLQHAMRNEEDSYCCYLLARRYADDDQVRWPYIRCQVQFCSALEICQPASCSETMASAQSCD